MKVQQILEARHSGKQQLFRIDYRVPLGYEGEKDENAVHFPVRTGWVEGKKLFVARKGLNWDPHSVSDYDFDTTDEYEEWVDREPWIGWIVAIGTEQSMNDYLDELQSEFSWDAEVEMYREITDEEASKEINET